MISEITSIGDGTAKIKVGSGEAQNITFKNIEDLLNQARTLEQTNWDAFLKGIEDYLKTLSGKDALTLQDVLRLKTLQQNFKKRIEGLTPAEQKAWIEKYNQFLNQTDTLVGQKPLSVELADGRKILVRNPAGLFNEIIQRFKILDQNGKIDLTRLPGITAEDLKALETFQEYLNSRKIGSSVDLPVFDLYSPYGVLELIDRLVRKYPASKAAGPIEVLHEDFLRFIDGTKPVYDAAVEAARKIFVAHRIAIPEGPLTLAVIRRLLQDLQSLQDDLKNAMNAVLESFKGEKVFKDLLASQITGMVNQGVPGSKDSGYSAIWSAVDQAISKRDIQFEINGAAVKVSWQQLQNFLYGLPSTTDILSKYPGIHSDIPADFLKKLHDSESYWNLSRVNLTDPAKTSEIYASTVGKLELLDALLKAWAKDVVTADGQVNFDRLRFRMLISQPLEIELGKAEEYLKSMIDQMEAFGKKPYLTVEDYQAMKALLAKVQKELQDRFNPLLKLVIYDTTNEVTVRIAARFQKLVESFNQVLSQVKVGVDLPDGSRIVFDPREVNGQVIQKILEAIAFRNYGGNFDRASFLKMAGIDEAALKDLFSSQDFSFLTAFSFGVREANKTGDIALSEILFSLIPKLIQKFQTKDTGVLTQKLTSGVKLSVEIGKNLEQEIRNVIGALGAEVLKQIHGVEIKTLEDLLKLCEMMKGYAKKMAEALKPFADKLSASEISQVEYWLNVSWGNPNSWGAVVNAFDQKVAAIQFLEVDGVRVAVQELLNIPGFPWSKDYDKDLFPGIQDSDISDIENSADAWAYRRIQLKSQSAAWPGLSAVGRIQLLVKLVKRTLAAKVPNLTHVKDGITYVNREEFRKEIKGVRAIQEQLVKDAQTKIEEIQKKLETMRKGAYTVEEIEAMHKMLTDLRESLIKMLSDKAGKHERDDVMAVESNISKIFQDRVFSLFVSIIGAADLIVKIDGQDVTVPVKQIMGAIAAFLKQKGIASPAASDLSALFGVDMDMIRNLHKLEEFLGEQIVGLPKNGEQVQIISKISELGWMQLASIIVKQYGKDILKDGKVDVAKLIQLLTNKDLAVKYVNEKAQALFQGKMAELQNIFKDGFNPATLAKIMKILEDAKTGLVSLMNDFLSGKNDPKLQDLLEQTINSLYDSLKVARDNFWKATPFEYEVDGKKVSVKIDSAMIQGFIAFIEKYLQDHPGASKEPIWEPIDNLKTGTTRDHRYPIWLPFPPKDGFDRNSHLTEFGAVMLFTQLLAKYGEFAVKPDASGTLQVDLNLFLNELGQTDQSRAERRLAIILKNELPGMKNWIDSLRGSDGAFPVDKLKELTEKYLALKSKLTSLAKNASAKSGEVWDQFISLYEQTMFGGKLSVTINGTKVTFDPKALDDILMKLYGEGKLNPDLMKKLDEMIQKGESQWQYQDFKYLRSWWFDDWKIFLLSGKTGQFQDMVSGNQDLKGMAGKFTLGDLLRIPGINSDDLASGLDTAEKNYLKVTPMDPAVLLGLLDMRTIAPGSGVDVGGMLKSVQSNFSNQSFEAIGMDLSLGRLINIEDRGLAGKSQRFRVLEFLPALFEAMGIDKIVRNGQVDSGLFGLELQDKIVLAHKEKLLSASSESSSVIRKDGYYYNIRAEEEEKKKMKLMYNDQLLSI
ncbi:MAG: hypothetical protein EXS63_08460 [Candidatus Omnitrophica bacterium]|nr:hypothetical protein [Candidatus Omnitrophota bacterium]